MTLSAANVPREYLRALPDASLQRVVAYHELGRSSAVMGILADIRCSRTAGHLTLLRETLLGDDDPDDEKFVWQHAHSAATVEGYYITHEILPENSNEWWPRGGLYTTVGLYVVEPEATDATTYLTALRWDEPASAWRLPWETTEETVDAEALQGQIPVLRTTLPPGDVPLRSILMHTMRAYSNAVAGKH